MTKTWLEQHLPKVTFCHLVLAKHMWESGRCSTCKVVDPIFSNVGPRADDILWLASVDTTTEDYTCDYHQIGFDYNKLTYVYWSSSGCSCWNDEPGQHDLPKDYATFDELVKSLQAGEYNGYTVKDIEIKRFLRQATVSRKYIKLP